MWAAAQIRPSLLMRSGDLLRLCTLLLISSTLHKMHYVNLTTYEDSVESQTPEITIFYIKQFGSFTFAVSNFEPRIEYLTPELDDMANKFDQYLLFEYEKSNSNIFQLTPTDESRYYEVRFSKNCLFPVMAASFNGYPVVGMSPHLSSFHITADIIGIGGLNTLELESGHYHFSNFLDMDPKTKQDIYSQSIDLSDYEDPVSLNVLLFCPFFASQEHHKFTFEIMMKKRNNQKVTKFDHLSNESSEFAKDISVPYLGEHLLMVSQLTTNTQFSFSSSNQSVDLVYFNFTFSGEEYRLRYLPPSIVLPPVNDLVITLINKLNTNVVINVSAKSTFNPAIIEVNTTLGIILGVTFSLFGFLVIVFLVVYFRKRIFVCMIKETKESHQSKIVIASDPQGVANQEVSGSYHHAAMIMQSCLSDVAPSDPEKILRSEMRIGEGLRLSFGGSSVEPPSESFRESPVIKINIDSTIYPNLEDQPINERSPLDNRFSSAPHISIFGREDTPLRSAQSMRENFFFEDDPIPIMRVQVERILKRMQANNPAEKIIIEVEQPHDECSDIEVEDGSLEQKVNHYPSSNNHKVNTEQLEDNQLMKSDSIDHKKNIVIPDDPDEEKSLSLDSKKEPEPAKDKESELEDQVAQSLNELEDKVISIDEVEDQH